MSSDHDRFEPVSDSSRPTVTRRRFGAALAAGAAYAAFNPESIGGQSPVSGPIARTVADVALFLSAIAGGDARNPLSIDEDPARFRAPLGTDFKGIRIAWWGGLGGIPFEPEIRRVVDSARKVFEDLGCVVEEAEPDFTGVDEAFPLLRFVGNHSRYAPLIKERPEWVKDTIKFEVDQASVPEAATSAGRSHDRPGCSNRAACSSSVTRISFSRSHRSSRSTSTPPIRRRFPARR